MRSHPRITGLLFSIAAALSFCWVGFYNGFPLVYSDTSTYLESGFTLETPLDRPITYGLLLRLFSLNGLTVWTIIFLQSFLLALVIWLLCREFFFTVKQRLIAAGSITLSLALFTGLPIVSSELIADIFTSITLLSLFLLLFGKTINRREKIFLYVLFLISVACHISHVLIALSLLAMIALILLLRKKLRQSISFKPVAITAVLSVLAMFIMMSSVSKSRHVFMMGHLIETGILDEYLNDHCATENFKVCEYRNRMPEKSEDFIWNLDGDSVLILTGGWSGSKEEYSQIISGTFSEGKYLRMHLIAAMKGTAQQLVSINCGEGLGYYDTASLVSQRIKKYFPGAYADYAQSRQSKNEFAGLPVIDLVNRIAIAISFVAIAGWWIFRRKKSERYSMIRTLILMFTSAYLLNCAICSTLAIVANRFAARLSWMIVLAAVLLIMEWILNRKKSSAS